MKLEILMTVIVKITVVCDMRLSGLVERNKCAASYCQWQHICLKLSYRSTRPDNVTAQKVVSDTSVLKRFSVTVVECLQDKDSITGATGQGQGRRTREEEEKDKQFD